MQRRPLFWFVISLLALAGAIYFWRLGDKWQAQRRAARLTSSALRTKAEAVLPISAIPKSALQLHAPAPNAGQKASAKSRFPYRLTNTSRSLKELLGNDKAILLANALIDTANPVKLAIPDNLRAAPHSGSYVVQASGPLDNQFRALLAEAGATIISYIPNNAYLVRVSDAGAQALSANPLTQSVLTYEPYYKLDSSLLALAMEQSPLPPNTGVNVVVFPDALGPTVKALAGINAIVVGTPDNSPFGPELHVFLAPNTLPQLAGLPGVQLVSAAHQRVSANDLSRTTLGVSSNTVITTSYLGLTGNNVLVNINDSGVDATHPDLAGRVTGDTAGSLVDNLGHGTHVAGTILGSGAESATVTNAQGSVPGASFRGMAPNALAYSISIFSAPNANSANSAFIDSELGDSFFGQTSDTYLQQQAALTNAPISNNSWNYDGSPAYDIAAASYDAAVRDALPGVPGPQPVVFVFSAGNAGQGSDDGSGGSQDTILSPATAKNVITVGAVEQLRNITNVVLVTDNSTGTNVVSTNTPFLASSDSSNEVASFSSRGNVGVNVEGLNGRFKPDLIAPGTFVVSDRSSTWDELSYYNPTNVSFFTYFDQTADTNSLTLMVPGIPVPDGALQMIITVQSNSLSAGPLPDLPIYVALNDFPTTGNLVGSNQVVLPTNSLPLNSGDIVYIGVGGTTNQAVNFDVEVELISTNNVGNYFQSLSNLNDSIGSGPPFYYRYESGTSMSAAGVSGMLACMEEFFEQRFQLTNSPALMKALLINGARCVNTNVYDFNVTSPVTSGGWGLPSLPNTIPAALANLNPGEGMPANAPNIPLLFFDQSPANALATGQSKTRSLVLAPTGTVQPLRVTLVWTDLPGNPAAGVKLVNNLVLVVTNLDTGDVFYGNDIPGGSVFNEPWDTNASPNIDLVNNVQNVYLAAPLSTNYSITVMAQRVNVNAVTANTNNVVQDYALVISSGDAGAVPNPYSSLTEQDLFSSTTLPVLTVVTDSVPIFNQRVGANPQFAPTTNGLAQQWNFYIYTNTPSETNMSFTNVAFITFLPPELAVPRLGAFDEVTPPNVAATRYQGSDIDLYASTDPSLTNLNPAAIAGAQKSVSQIGNEAVFFTNSAVGQIFYIGVKSESQEGGQFDFVGFASNLPFTQTGSNGDVQITMHTVPAPLPGGTPPEPGNALFFGVATQPVQIRKVVVSDTVTCSNFSDYIGTLNFANNFVVLNNHSFFTNTQDTTETFTYDDSGEGNTPNARKSDGPGSLTSLVGLNASSGAWLFYMVNDNSLTDTGEMDNLTLTVSPQPPNNKFFEEDIQPQGWFYDFVDVPPNATNLTISVGVPDPATLPLTLYVRRGAFPTTTTFDKSLALVSGQTNSISITLFDTPPLNPGRYYYGIFNPNTVVEQVDILTTVGISVPSTAQSWLLSTNVPMALPDDAVTNSGLFVGVNEAVADVQVGVRINHPRESDLTLTLISPSGTRVLLSENRGGLDTNGYGSGVNITNVFPTTTSGTLQSETNTLIINTNGGVSSGTLVIGYNMFTVPDDMRIYYNNVLIFDSGLVSLTGTFTVNYGPGTATNIDIVMNAPGTNPGTNTTDMWNYTATAIQQKLTYTIFTDDTNKTTLPIKFAVPPFGTNLNGFGTLFSDFENWAPTNYPAPGPVDGWTVVSNLVTVLTAPPSADSGTNSLALRNGGISQTLATTAGTTYSLQFADERAVPLDPVHWWPGNSNTMDIMGISPQDGTWLPLGSDSYALGEVNAAFNFDPAGSNYVKVVANPSLDIGSADGFTIDCWIRPANVKQAHPLLEWNDGSDLGAGLSLWISASGPGALSANLVDTSAARTNHILATTNSLIGTTAFQHVALTYNRTNQGQATLYYNGVAVASTNLGANLALQTSSSFDLYFGKHLTSTTVLSRFAGQMDEIGMYNQVLTAAQIRDIYTAGGLGRCGTLTPPSVCPAPMANVLIGGAQVATVTCGPTATNWVNQPLSFTATGSGTTLEIDSTNNPSGVMLDAFTLTAPGQNNYYLPEEPLAKLIGENALGNWQLEVLDNRAGATNPQPTLVSWELNFDFVTATPSASPLVHGVTQSNFVAPNGIVYYAVAVPPWAQYATNILFNVNGGPLNVLFNQNFLPGTNSSDILLMPGVAASNSVTLVNGAGTPPLPPLVPGQTYYLGVQNPGTTVASFSIQVDFNIIVLTNGIPYTNQAPVGSVQYYEYTVSTNNPVAVAFEILNPSGNVELVAQQGPPLPDLTPGDYNYISDNPGADNQAIVVLTNSTPVALTPGLWYLGVFNNDTNTVNYRVRALESDATNYPNIIVLTNGVPLFFSSGPGVALTNFFEFIIPPSNTNAAALFELYNLNGNADLTLQLGVLPYYPYVSPPYFAGSFQPGTTPEQIVIRTSDLGNINGSWFLGVPNNDPNPVNYFIRATLATNGVLIPYYTNTTVAISETGPGFTNGLTLTWPTVNGETYVVLEATNLAPPIVWTPISTNVATGATAKYVIPPPPPGIPFEFFEIEQVPTP